MYTTRLISADSHVLVKPEALRERLPRGLQATFDEGMAAQAVFERRPRRCHAIDGRLRHGGGQ